MFIATNQKVFVMKSYVNIYEDGESYYTDIDAAATDADNHTKENGDEAIYIRTELKIDGFVIDRDVFLTEDE